MDFSSELRKIPSVTEVLDVPEIASLLHRYSRTLVVRAIRSVLAEARRQVSEGQAAPAPSDMTGPVLRELAGSTSRSLRSVINATGVVVHTNLGRSVLASEAVEAVIEAATGHVNLEYDLGTGERSSRQDHVTGLLVELTGAEAALVVNNNAGAVLLCLDTLASGREVVVSRGQLVEIGGSFRLPDIMAKSGARLVEVGTTNRTYISDYAGAIGPSTAMLLRVHPSNFRQVGYTASASIGELVSLGAEREVLVMDDQGSGTLLDLERYGIVDPPIRDSISAGAGIVTCSGDKLLGGPQAGIILGKKNLIDRLRCNPLARALRIDKLSLAALEGTLRLYRDEERALSAIPTLSRLAQGGELLEQRAIRLAGMVRKTPSLEVKVAQSTSQAGGGSNPGEDLPSWVVAVRPSDGKVTALEEALRRAQPPVIARIHRGFLVLDMRTLGDHDLEAVAEALLDNC
ncbi:MAG: L-seryl-tRNA(Sec) selenium transferase [Bacillota bacterium]